MAKTRPGKRDLDFYTIRGTNNNNKVVRAGDCVLMRSSETDMAPYVARVEKIEVDNKSNVKVRVRWYYRPEESMGGRRQFHGAKELFLSDHYDTQSAHTIEGKCIVHSFKNYTKLENVGSEDYYCRFEYKAATGAFIPDRVAVYCKCEMPYNPDDLMVQCDGCKDWYHPACVKMSIDQAKQLDHFVCADCTSKDDAKKSQEAVLTSPLTNGKSVDITCLGPIQKRRRRRRRNILLALEKWFYNVFRGKTQSGVQTPEDMNAFGVSDVSCRKKLCFSCTFCSKIVTFVVQMQTDDLTGTLCLVALVINILFFLACMQVWFRNCTVHLW